MNITISNKIISAEINSFGAELISLNKNSKNYIWTINKTFWDKTSPILFPIVGSLINDNYTISNKKYSLPRHGFARNHEFVLKQQSDDSVTFSLTENKQSLEIYPFQFELEVNYTLEGNKLNIGYSVINNSNSKMPFSIGAHPAFAIDSNFEDYSLQFENDSSLVSSELKNGLFSGSTNDIILENNHLPLSYSLFEKDALVFKNLKTKKLLILKDQKPHIKINFDSFPHLGIWTKNNAPFLCIEPWQGYADSVNSNGDIFKKEGIITITEGESYQASFSIELV